MSGGDGGRRERRREPPPPPAGYRALALHRADGAARIEGAVLAGLLNPLVDALVGPDGVVGTLYEYAARHPRARTFAGRGIAYAVPLPDGATSVVVRHSRHGGLLAPLTGDRFLAPTRAPHELATSLRLRAHGVPTPEVVAYVTYPAGPLLRRADVATREVPRAKDLAVALLGKADEETRRGWLDATARLLAELRAAGARHADLNLKNVLLAPDDAGRCTAHVLDVDRVTFAAPGDAAAARANFDRLARSARKWRDLYGATVDEGDLAWLLARSDELARGA